MTSALRRVFRSISRPGGNSASKQAFCVMAAMDKIASKILHDKENKCFYMQFNDGGKALLDYDKAESDVLDFYHTEVPVNQQGKGIAKQIVKEAMDYAFSKDFKVKPTCTYVLKYVKENLTDSQMEQIKM